MSDNDRRIDEAIELLVAMGFRREVDLQTLQAFGNRKVVLVRNDVLVEFLRDRGYWTVKVGSNGWASSFYVDIWRACLDGAEVGLDAPPVAEQLEFVSGRLMDIANAIVRGDSVESCLQLHTQRLLQRRRWAGIAGPPKEPNGGE